MGDRANVYVVDRDPEHGIYFYTHSSGTEWPEELQKGLKFGRERWDHPSYLTRILASSMFADCAGRTTGGGISTFLCDNKYPILICDIPNGNVAVASEGRERDSAAWLRPVPFAEYVEMTTEELRNHRHPSDDD